MDVYPLEVDLENWKESGFGSFDARGLTSPLEFYSKTPSSKPEILPLKSIRFHNVTIQKNIASKKVFDSDLAPHAYKPLSIRLEEASLEKY